jgi:hypothetical protein
MVIAMVRKRQSEALLKSEEVRDFVVKKYLQFSSDRCVAGGFSRCFAVGGLG